MMTEQQQHSQPDLKIAPILLDGEQMTELQQERRATQRFPFQLPVTVKHPAEGDIETRTRDLSSRGVCFYLHSPLAIGSNLQLTLTLPTEITLTEPVRVRCLARVVRVEQDQQGGTLAGAVIINHYEFLKSATGSDAAQSVMSH
jgi:hypothetical protein